MNNVLFYDVTPAFGGSSYTMSGRQITVHDCDYLTSDYGDPTQSIIVFTNSLFSQVADNGTVENGYFFCATDDGANVFKTVGAGLHYLADDSPYRGAGTSDIPDWLATNLTQCTTFAPIIWTNSITEDMIFEPVVQRCTDVPDLGFHYPALDYLLTPSRSQIPRSPSCPAQPLASTARTARLGVNPGFLFIHCCATDRHFDNQLRG
jgi:hypothetical protein